MEKRIDWHAVTKNDRSNKTRYNCSTRERQMKVKMLKDIEIGQRIKFIWRDHIKRIDEILRFDQSLQVAEG